MTVKTVAILGAGQMGRGIAEVCALAAIKVDLYDAAASRLPAALEFIGADLARQMKKNGLRSETAPAALAQITPRQALGDWLCRADVVIEAVTEDAGSKKQLYAASAAYLSDNTVLASNTSSLSITGLAAAAPDAARFIGMHFMNPAAVNPLVEIIRGAATDDLTYQRTCALAQQLGKEVVTAADHPGFIANRILLPMLNEAICALQEKTGSVTDIDRTMVIAMRHPMGPLMLADFIGLDTCLAILRVLHDTLGQEKYRPCPLLAELVAAGELGKKSGAGFYDYRGETPQPAARFVAGG